MNQDLLFYTQRIKSLYSFFSKSEKAIADYILANPDRAATYSSKELACASCTSPATVVRFCRKLGFSGFPELKMSMSQKWISSSENDPLNVDVDDPVSVIMQKVIVLNKKVIEGLAMTIDEEALITASDAIINARRFMILGDGGSGTSAQNAFDVFLKLGIHCEYISDIFFQVAALHQLNEHDVLLAITNSGRSQNTIQNIKTAKDRGVFVIGIVGLPGSPASHYMDVEIDTNVICGELFSDLIAARLCEITAISAINSVIACKLKKAGKLDDGSTSDILDIKRIRWTDKV